MTAPIIPLSSHPYSPSCSCKQCDATWRANHRARNPHLYGADTKPALNWSAKRWLALASTGIAITAALLALSYGAQAAFGRVSQVQPVRAPHALLRARAACPLDKPLKCRAALRHAYEAAAWQRGENLKLAREMVGNVAAWTCIHNGKGATSGTGEGSWTANTHNGYFGGLQMDRNFMHTYGTDMIRRHHGGLANTWTPREQIIVAQRAYAQNRGYAPWPQTSHACGLR